MDALNQRSKHMRKLVYLLFSLVLIGSAVLLTATPTLADSGENNGNHFGQINNGNNGNQLWADDLWKQLRISSSP